MSTSNDDYDDENGSETRVLIELYEAIRLLMIILGGEFGPMWCSLIIISHGFVMSTCESSSDSKWMNVWISLVRWWDKRTKTDENFIRGFPHLIWNISSLRGNSHVISLGISLFESPFWHEIILQFNENNPFAIFIVIFSTSKWKTNFFNWQGDKVQLLWKFQELTKVKAEDLFVFFSK